MKLLFILMLSLILVQSNGQLNIQIQPDGRKFTRILLNGATSAKFDLVFIGDGFTTADQALFNKKVDEAVAGLSTIEPYASQMCSFNIWRVNVISKDRGITNPATGQVKRTALHCRFGNRKTPGEVPRCIYTDIPDTCYAAAGVAPSFDAVFVLVNDPEWGGCEGGLVFATIAPEFQTIVTHELGHKVGDLADEYACLQCDGTDLPRVYSDPEPAEANLTKDTVRSTTKWASLILPATHIPTTGNSPMLIGLYEGGKYCTKGIYRSQFTCLMENPFSGFCIVCKQAMMRRLSAYCSPRSR